MALHPRLRSALTLTALGLLVVLAAIWGWNATTQPLPGLEAGDNRPCEPRIVPAGTRLAPSDITVSVFNTSTTEGLASKVMTELTRRGFGAGEVGNAPREKVARVEIRTTDRRDPAVALVASQFGGNVRIRETDEPALGPGVVVLVERFGELAAGRRAITTRAETQVCSPLVTEVP